MALTAQTAATAFSAMGSDARLAVLRLLIQVGRGGLPVGDIAQRTGMKASTLAHHLKILREGGLIAQDRRGREIISRADFDHLGALAEFILSECCALEEAS